jgi:hypothetical protein
MHAMSFGQIRRDLQTEPRLADATGTCKGHEPDAGIL